MRASVAAAFTAALALLWPGSSGAEIIAPAGGIEQVAQHDYVANIAYGEPGQAISLGTNPFINCSFVWSLTGNQALEYGGARGQLENGFDPSISTSTELFHFASCPRFTPPILMAWPNSDPTPPIITEALHLAAQSRLQIPVESPQANPPGTTDFPLITQLPTWFWSNTYSTQTATASLAELNSPINASITLTATATSTTWNPGDGSTPITCDQGIEWTKELQESDTTCSHTYTNRNNGQPFTLAATTTWSLTITCQPTTICAALPEPDPVSITTTRDVTVISIYPVLTS